MSTRWTPEAFERSLGALRLPERPALPRRAAVAVVLHFADEVEVLLMKRTEREGDPWSGQISLPGGRFESTDRDLLHTAVRETHEELGFDLDRAGRRLGRLTPLQARARGKIVPMDVAPFVFAVEQPPALALEPAEVDAAFWFPLWRAASGTLDRPFALQHEGRELQLASWRFGKHTVWGMTHRILSGLIEVVQGSGDG